MFRRFRESAFHYRGYRGFNTLDRIAIVVGGVGAILLLGTFILDSDGLLGVGFFLLVVGFLILIRDFPGEGG